MPEANNRENSRRKEYEEQLSSIADNPNYARLEAALKEFFHNASTDNFNACGPKRTSPQNVDLNEDEIKALAEMLVTKTDSRTVSVALALNQVQRLNYIAQNADPKAGTNPLDRLISSIKERSGITETNSMNMNEEQKISLITSNQIYGIPFNNQKAASCER